jgi:hypothetical protein
MNQKILHVGLDVDDTQYHGLAFNKESGEVIDFRCRPTLKGLLTQLDKLQRHFRGLSIRLCYEASYVGYCLQRDPNSHPNSHVDGGMSEATAVSSACLAESLAGAGSTNCMLSSRSSSER